MTQPLLLLAGADFDAYLPERAASNAFSRPRIEVKQRAIAWARSVAVRLAAEGIAASVEGSDEHPSLRNKRRVERQWVFFWRDEAAREELGRLLDQRRSIAEALDDPSPYTRHAFLALRIDARGLEVCFAVHPEAGVDVDNLRARLAAPPLAEELLAALRGLPDEFEIGTTPDDRRPCAGASAQEIVDMIARAAEGQVPLWIGWSVPREVALDHAAILDDQLEDAIVALAPIYRLVAWSRDNDHIALDRRLEGAMQERARAHAELEAENERWRAERAAEVERLREQAKARTEEQRQGAAPRRATLATLFKPRVEPRHAPADEPARDAVSQHAPDPAPTAPPPAPRGPAISSSGGALEKGARVAVASGPFAGKVGVVSELDGRGGARVLLGLLSTRVQVGELVLVPDARERPALPVSHRRPAAQAARKTR
jgi:sRNA-binding protein